MKVIKQSLRLIWVFVTLLCSNYTSAQNPVIDSLENALQNHTERDTVRVNLLNKLALKSYKFDDTLALKYISESSKISNELDYHEGNAENALINGLIYHLKADYEKALQEFNKANKLFETLNQKKGISKSLNNIAAVYIRMGEYSKSISYNEKALVVNQSIKDKTIEASILNSIGTAYANTGEFDSTLKYFKASLEITKSLSDQNRVAKGLSNIGSVYNQQGNFPLAVEYYTKALLIFDSLDNGDKGVKANTLNNLGNLYIDQGKLKKALNCFNQSIEMHEKEGNKYGLASSYMNVGTLYMFEDSLDLAKQYFDKALEMSKDASIKDNMALCYGNIGHLEYYRGNYKNSIDYFNKGLSINFEIGNWNGKCLTYIGLTRAYIKTKNYKKALENILKGQAIANQYDMTGRQKTVHEFLSKIYYATKEYEKAYENQVKYKELSDSLFNRENIQKITALEYEYEYHARLDSARRIELELTNEVAQGDIYYEQSQRQILYGIIGFLALVILLVTVISILRLRNVKSQSEQIIVEQKLLRSQMTPHFIFNSISVLQGIVSNKEYDKSEVYMSKFSKLLRRVLENSKDKAVKLSDELQVIENYLAIQNLGVENLYDYKITVDENVNIEAVLLPPMIIQPFIENAIEHGFKNKEKDRKIEIKLKFEGDDLICVIEDNGVGINFNALNQSSDRKSMSTAITAKRLKMLAKEYKVNTDVKIEDRSVFNEVGTLVTLMLPYKMS